MIGHQDAATLLDRLQATNDLPGVKAVLADFLRAIMTNLEEFAANPGPD